MSEQRINQMVVIDQATLNPHQIAQRVSLFMPNGQPFAGGATQGDSPVVIPFTIPGNLEVGDTTVPIPLPFSSGRVVAVQLAAQSPSNGADIKANFRINGGSRMFTTEGEPSILEDENVGSITEPDGTLGDRSWSGNSYLTVDITQVGSNSSGGHLVGSVLILKES